MRLRFPMQLCVFIATLHLNNEIYDLTVNENRILLAGYVYP